MDIDLYSAALAPLDMRAFQVAMAILSERERSEGETAFPTLGTILAVMEDAREVFPQYSAGLTSINIQPVFDEAKTKRLQG